MEKMSCGKLVIMINDRSRDDLGDVTFIAALESNQVIRVDGEMELNAREENEAPRMDEIATRRSAPAIPRNARHL